MHVHKCKNAPAIIANGGQSHFMKGCHQCQLFFYFDVKLMICPLCVLGPCLPLPAYRMRSSQESECSSCLLVLLNRVLDASTIFSLSLLLQLLGGRAGEGNTSTSRSALLGPQPPEQPPQRQQPSLATSRLPPASDGQLPLASLQPHVPHDPRSADRPGDERHPVPHSHGLRRAAHGTAAGHGSQHATGHAQQRLLSQVWTGGKGHTNSNVTSVGADELERRSDLCSLLRHSA